MNDWTFCWATLEQVSRTFSKPIGMLDEPLRRAVTVGYLLCRAADSIEDDAAIPLATKDRLYADFLAVLDGRGDLDELARVHAEVESLGGAEAALVADLGRVMRVMATLPESMQRAIARWVAEMTRGMAVYSHRAPGRDGVTALTTLSDLERYCYFVAGTVGHLLTDLFVEALGAAGRAREPRLRSLAEEFGLGLQLTNILKDLTDDRERGVSFVPRTLCDLRGLEVRDLVDPARRSQAHDALEPVFDRAERALDGALSYCLALPPDATAIRLFCLLPLWMAVRTLAHARGNDDQLIPGRAVKISRQEVGALIQDCLARVRDDDALRAGYRALRQRAA